MTEHPWRAARRAKGGGPAFDPGDHTVAEVLTYAADHPDEAAAIREVEAAGKGRVTILEALT